MRTASLIMLSTLWIALHISIACYRQQVEACNRHNPPKQYVLETDESNAHLNDCVLERVPQEGGLVLPEIQL